MPSNQDDSASDTPPPVDAAEAALATALECLLSDQAATIRLAASVLSAPRASASQRAFASGLQAAVALRRNDNDTGLHLLTLADDTLGTAGSADGAWRQRAADWLQHVRAQWLYAEGQFADAESLLRALHRRADERSLVEACLSAATLGIVLSMQGDDIGALDLFYQALALARRSGNQSLLVNALNNLGSFQGDLLNLDDALPLLEECLAGALQLGSRRQVIFAAGNLVQVLCAAGQAERALTLAREHLIGTIRPDDPPSLQRAEEIAQVLLDTGHLDEADATLGRDEQVDPTSNETSTLRVWLRARVLLARGRPAEALALCKLRRQQLDTQGVEDTLAVDRLRLLRVAALAADRVGEHAQAYRLLEEAFATEESLQGRAAKSRQMSLQISHRLQQAEWERDAARQMASRLEGLNSSLQAQIERNERLQAQLRAQATEDPLTGLHNRRYLLEAGVALLALLQRRGEPVAVAMVDLDHFKQVNDRHGHEVGDEVLRGFARLARSDMRAEDLVCRYGGEEFVLLLPGARAADAVVRLAGLLQRFSRQGFADGTGGVFKCSFSAGVADNTAGDEALLQLLKRADAALYAAKAAGRARVVAG